MSDWRPIETAPHDGSWVDLWRPPAEIGLRQCRVTARWKQFEDGDAAWVWPDDVYDAMTPAGLEHAEGMVTSGDVYESNQFTHWMPLPSCPPSPTPVEEKDMGEWKPIETAPLNGRQFLAALTNGWVTIISAHPEWQSDVPRYGWWRTSTGLSLPYEPSHPRTDWEATHTLRATHWMPLPEPPKSTQLEGES